MRYEHVLGIGLAVALSACGAAPPREALTAAEASIRAAEVGGAEGSPKASLALKHARDQVQAAKALMEDGDNERATLVIERAQVDAEVALAQTREEKVRKEADELLEELSKLKAKIDSK